MRPWDDPVLVALGPLEVRWYGLFLAASIVVALAALVRLLSLRGADAPWEQATGLAVRVLPAGMLGARLAFVVQNWPSFDPSPLRVLAVWDGGLSIHGALLGGLLALGWGERSRARFLARADLLLTVLPLAQAIGRWGNLLNRELLGLPTRVPWALQVEPAFRPAAFAGWSTFHPVFLYESLANLALFALLWRRATPRAGRPRRGDRASSRRPPLPRAGTQTALYLAGYSFIRLAVEFLRIGTPVLAGLTLAQWVSGLLLLLGLAGWLRWNRTTEPPEAAGG